MRSFQHIRFDVAVAAGCLLVLVSLAMSAWWGKRGFPHHESLKLELSKLTEEKAKLVAARSALEAKVALLRPESVDPDLLDELARRQLYMAKPGEVLVHIGEEGRK